MGVRAPIPGVGVEVDDEEPGVEAIPRTSESSAADFDEIFLAFRRRARW